MRLAIPLAVFFSSALWEDIAVSARSLDHDYTSNHYGGGSASPSGDFVSPSLFTSLERMARLVDIAYCVGTTGVAPPFSCASRCSDFPTLRLVQTWNTGMLMTDSCGYVAVDHGLPLSLSSSSSTSSSLLDIPHEPAIIVAFRGTYSITNTVIDLSTVPQEYVPYPEDPDEGGDDDDHSLGNDGEREGDRSHCTNCTVHTGFLASWRSARPLVLPVLRAARAAHPTYPVHLVGHSLGGAVAALAALELRLALGWGDDVRVTTFGEPRVGNQALADYLDTAFGLVDTTPEQDGEDGEEEGEGEGLAYRRVTHVSDPVPLLPPGEWGYRPHAGEIFIAKADLQPAPEDLRLCRGDRDPRCISGGSGDSDSDSDGVGRGDSLLGRLGRMLRRHRHHRQDRGQDQAEMDVDVEVDAQGRFQLWQLFFAHRDYFWRLGLCVPGGDPTDWGRRRYNVSSSEPGPDDELDTLGEL